MNVTTPLIINMAFQSAIILILAVGATSLMRRASAATRHLVWTASLVACLLLPVLNPYLPQALVFSDAPAVNDSAAGQESFESSTSAGMDGSAEAWTELPPASLPPVNPAPSRVGRQRDAVAARSPRASVSTESKPASESPSIQPASSSSPNTYAWLSEWRSWLPWAWGIVAILVLLPFLIGCASLAYLRNTSQVITGGSWPLLARNLSSEIGLRQSVVLLQSTKRMMPMTWGFAPLPGLRPCVVIPADALSWKAARRRVVLLHELAHIKRFDGLSQLIMQLACALFWFNPLVWYAAHRMLVEREMACDDIVIAKQTLASEYAEHLLELATNRSRDLLNSQAGIAILRRDALSGRIAALLDEHRNRQHVTSWGLVAIVMMFSMTAISVSMLRAQAAPLPVLSGLQAVSLDESPIVNTMPETLATTAGSTTQPAARNQTAPTSPTTQPAESMTPAERVAASRKVSHTPGYSLREEPQRIIPRTLEMASPSPAEAIVMNWPIRWWASYWSTPDNTHNSALIMHPGEDGRAHPRLIVTEPGKRKVWVKYLDMPFDANDYPLLVFTYRATNIDEKSKKYVLYLDDTVGPFYGGIRPVNQNDLIADGNIHTLTLDLRIINPIGKIIGMGVGVHAPKDATQPAIIDLIDLRFESVKLQPVEQKTWPFTVNVTDENNQPLPGAKVTLHAERLNWATAVQTDNQGRATLPQSVLQGEAGDPPVAPLMLRVEADGRLPVEIRDLPTDPSRNTANVTLLPAAPLRGVALDDKGQPLANVAVHVQANGPPGYLEDRWSRQDTQAFSDAQGRWETVPMAILPVTKNEIAQAAALTPDTMANPILLDPNIPQRVHLTMHHPRYPLYIPVPRVVLAPSSHLSTGNLKLRVAEPLKTITLDVRDEQNQSVQQAMSLIFKHEYQSVQTPAGQSPRVTFPAQGLTFLLVTDGFVPQEVQITPAHFQTPNQPLVVQLSQGNEVEYTLLDQQNQPIANARVSVIHWADLVLSTTAPGRTQPINGWHMRDLLFEQRSDEQGKIRFRIQGPTQVRLRIRKGGTIETISLMLPPNDVIRLKVPTTQPASPIPRPSPTYDPQRIGRRLS